MTSSDTLTYDQTTPHHPALSELGGGAKVNGLPPPDPVRMLTAEDCNQTAKQLTASCRVEPVAILQVEQAAGTYSKIAVTAKPTAVNLATFTLTKNGTGDVSITWPAGTFPSAQAKPKAHVTGNAPLLLGTESITNGARVRMQNAAGSPTDSHFDLEIF